MSLVTLITCTGGRPYAWSLCQKYILNQTYRQGTIQWIVVYDTPEALPLIDPSIEKEKRIQVEIHSSPKNWRLGINTQHFQMDEAIKFVKGDYVFVIEDDDCYLPNYIETMLFFLQKFDIVGQGNSRYYNLKVRSWKEWRNHDHTSLCETAIKRCKLELLDRAVNVGQTFFDMALWEIINNEKIHSNLLFNHLGLVCGMKGLPGKIGIGGGHHQLDASWTKDPFFEKLKSWVGFEYAKVYMGIKI